METICEFKQTFWNFFSIHQTKIYTCCIDGRNSNLQIQFNAQHLNGLDDDKVLGLSVNNCQFSKIPDNFNEKFKNICYLSINRCGLKEISNEDLKCFPNLFFLNLSENEIEFLPKNLFFGMTNLQYIFITFNKLLYIEPNIVDSFNPCINVVYNFSGEKKNNLKEELRNILFYSLAPSSSVKVAFDDKLNEIAELKATISKLQEKNVIAIESDRVKV
ncbi:hypothetical protein PVAND_017511 [Polypedilum vanderplanki]|uniref:Leucine rich repeat protein n=1 Tax=Polypedilum vanderplanki TaxID=319348 RepID=A0A9J6BIT9_POLVA|nr:hypothetical protein PVAND_017511 [Polypedilum vanderplanki]